jgi:hypothetical protein
MCNKRTRLVAYGETDALPGPRVNEHSDFGFDLVTPLEGNRTELGCQLRALTSTFSRPLVWCHIHPATSDVKSFTGSKPKNDLSSFIGTGGGGLGDGATARGGGVGAAR